MGSNRMENLLLPEHLIQKLEDIARQENRNVVEIITTMIEKYEQKTPSQQESDNAFKAIFGIYDDDITDMSTTVRETLQKYYQEKYGRPD